MNKTDSLLWVMRLHEGIRKLPDDARIYGFEMNRSSDIPHIEIHLYDPVEWPAVFDGMTFPSWTAKRIAVTPFVFAWWAEHREGDDETT